MSTLLDLKKQVLAKTNETITKIESMYDIKFSQQVKLRFNIDSARLAGEAQYKDFTVRINPHFLEKYPDETINTTVPHEVAHLGIYQLYWLNRKRRVDGHGPEWKSMMVRIGADPSRCHTMKADEGVGRQKPKYGYKCSECSEPIIVGPQVHSGIQRGQQRIPNCCGRRARLVFVGACGSVSYDKAREMVRSNQPVIEVPKIVVATNHKVPDPNTKIGKCYKLYAEYKSQNPSRQQWIRLFVQQAGCTPSGASTYLSSISKMF